MQEAESAAVTARDLRTRLHEDYPTHPPAWHGLALDQALHGGVLMRLGRIAEAEAALVCARKYQELMVRSPLGNGRRHEELAVIEAALAWVRLRKPAPVDELIPRLEKARGSSPPGERFRLALIGLARYRLGEWEQGVAAFRQVDREAAAGSGPVQWTTDDHLLRRMAEHQEEVAPAVAALGLALTHSRLGNPAEAERCYLRGRLLIESQRTTAGFRSVDVDTLRAEVEAVLGLTEPAPPPREKR